MNWYKIAQTEEKTSIYELLEEGQEEINPYEVLYNFIDQTELHIELPIKTIDNPKMLMTHAGDMTVWESYQFANNKSKELIEFYAKRKPNNNIIILNENKVLDGNHRVVAAILGGWELKAIDISEINKEE